MKIKVLTLLLLMPLFLSAQWIEKEVGNNIYVKFPSNPEYKINSGIAGKCSYIASYMAKSENCMFIIIIMGDVIPDYPVFLGLSNVNKKKLEDKFLDEYVVGKLSITDNTSDNSKHIKLDEYNGRECTYSAINPAIGERCKRFSKTFLIKNKTYSFEC